MYDKNLPAPPQQQAIKPRALREVRDAVLRRTEECLESRPGAVFFSTSHLI